MESSIADLKPHAPEIITSGVVEVASFYDKMDPRDVIPDLLEGVYVLVEDYYHNGLQVLESLREYLETKYNKDTFRGQREYREAYREASHNLILMVVEHELIVKKAPEIGWFKILYPNEGEFLIAFPDVQGLNSAWQWYLNGIEIDVLDIQLKPYYGVYFPTRFDHLELLDTWLQQYTGEREIAIDIGVGSGVLSFLLLEHGFSKVLGTDINENAIIGTSKESRRLGYSDRLTLRHGDLFADSDWKADLIVFNPPWLPAKHELDRGIDTAIYYPTGLFERFFNQVDQYLNDEGKLILLFSNLGDVTEEQKRHPIQYELQQSDRFSKETYLEKPVKAGSKNTRRKNWREQEKVELWVLIPKE